MKKKIYGLFFGDSITYGEYDGVFGGWVDILKRYALQKFNEGSSNEVVLFNLGIGGETTDGLVKRIHSEMTARNSPEGNKTFISYGANDLAIKEGDHLVSPEKFRNNIEYVIQQAKQFSMDIHLISIIPFSEKVNGMAATSGKLRNNQDVLKYNHILKNIAGQHQLSYIDFYSAFVKDKEALLSPDGVHPNEKGYGIMAETMIPLIDQYLK